MQNLGAQTKIIMVFSKWPIWKKSAVLLHSHTYAMRTYFSEDDRFFFSDKILMINRLVAKFLTSEKNLFRRINV